MDEDIVLSCGETILGCERKKRCIKRTPSGLSVLLTEDGVMNCRSNNQIRVQMWKYDDPFSEDIIYCGALVGGLWFEDSKPVRFVKFESSSVEEREKKFNELIRAHLRNLDTVIHSIFPRVEDVEFEIPSEEDEEGLDEPEDVDMSGLEFNEALESQSEFENDIERL